MTFEIVPITPILVDQEALETGTGGALLSSNVYENEHPPWSAGTAYAIGDRVIYRHAIYQRLVAGVSATLPSADAVNWAFVKTTSRWAFADASSSTQTVSSETIRMVLQPNTVFDRLAVINARGSTVRVKVESPIGTAYDQTLSFSGIASQPRWYEYFFEKRLRRTQTVHRFDVVDSTATVTIEIRPDVSGRAAVGVVLAGLARDYTLGASYGARLGVVDYSVKSVSPFGETILVERAYSKRAEFQVALTNEQTDSLFSLLAKIRATPALFTVTDLYESASLYGFLKDWSMSLSFPTLNYVDLQIESLA